MPAGRYIRTPTAEQIADFQRNHPEFGEIRPIPGHEGYVASNRGLIFSYLPSRGFRRLKNSPNSGGYPCVALHRGESQRSTVNVHLILAKTFLPPPDFNDAQVRHLDGNPQNTHIDNLKWGTIAENMQDMVDHGKSRRGTKNYNAKLDEASVLAILAKFDAGQSKRSLAREYGLMPSTVRFIVTGKTWNHLTGQKEKPIDVSDIWL